MFPDLRLLISATIATFFLAAMAGLYISLRVTHDQLTARTDVRATIEDNPVTRIAMGWPMPEQGRAAALRELATIAKYSPPTPGEFPSAPDRSDANMIPDEAQIPVPDNTGSIPQASVNEIPAQDAAGSTGVAIAPDTGALIQTDNPDVAGNTGTVSETENADTTAEKQVRRSAKKPPQVAKKKSVKVAQRRRILARAPERPAELPLTGYPLYLTVPVTN